MKHTGSPFTLEGSLPLLQVLPFGLQHVLCMFATNIAPIVILAGAVGLDSNTSKALIQNAMIIAGIGTLIQLYPCWKIGSRLPIVVGTSFKFLAIAISIGATQGMGTLMGAVIVGGIFEGLIGLFAKYWIKIVSPIVVATVIMAIGLSLLPEGAYSFAGGQGAADFGSLNNWIMGSVSLLSCILCLVIGKGTFRSISVLVGLAAGYITSVILGVTDLSDVQQAAGHISIPKILVFKPEFHLGSILSILCIYIISAVETIGDTTALAGTALKRNPSVQELSGAVACNGFVSTLAGVFGCLPVTSFTQNVGLCAMTKVVNRYSIAVGAALMIFAGIIPWCGAFLTSIPQAVLGGCTILIFGIIVFCGLVMVAKCGMTTRNMLIVSLSLSVGLGFTQASDMFNIFPQFVQDIFADNCLACVFVLAVLLNLIMPKEENQQI